MKIDEVKQLTIVPIDSLVIVNNLPKFNIDLSSVDKNINAIQWNNGSGEIEYIESETVRYNAPISSIEEYQYIIDLWENYVEESLPIQEIPEEILKMMEQDPNFVPPPPEDIV